MSKKIYISGKMGEKTLSQETIDKFARISDHLTLEGWSVVNPASCIYQESMQRAEVTRNIYDEYTAFLLWDIHRLAACNAIYMLRDWKDSPGATAEYYFAKAIGLEILYEDESNT